MPVQTLWQLQKTVYGRLRATAALTALLPAGENGIYDHIPPDAVFPYTAIGDTSARPFDTAGEEGAEIFLSIACFSRARGMREIRNIAGAVAAALHDAPLAVEGHHVVLCRNVSTDIAHPRTGGDVTCRFKKPPAYAALNGAVFRAGLELEVLP